MDYLKQPKSIKRILVGPIIFGLIIPIAVLDIFIELYHHVCFPVYRLALVSRKKYIKIDRYLLTYLSFIQKIYCIYCGYVNGVIHYWSVIGGVTEQYWCGISHQADTSFSNPQHHCNFAKYNSKKDFNQHYR